MDISILGKTPVAGDSPCGENIRYEPEFEELQQEIDKLSSPSASGTVDWKKVEDTSMAILATKSKDLLVAAYLSVALLQNHRERGLLQGIHLMLDMLTNFWPDMFPPKKRAKGRLRIIEWWRDKTEGLVERLAPLSFSETDFSAVLADLSSIDEFLEQNLEGAPSVLTIKRVLENVARVKKEERPKPKAAEADSAQKEEPHGAETGISSRTGAVPPPEVLEIENREQFDKALDHLLSGLRKTASYLKENDPSNPLGYRLWRSSIWLPIFELPPSDNGKTRIPPPQSQVVSILEGLEDNGDWKALLEAAEANLVQFPFWLDLNWYSWTALKGLGPDYLKAAQAVERETGAFVAMLPGLTDMSFSDGRPFAGEQAAPWINNMKQETGTGQAGEPAPLQVPSGGEVDELCLEARKAAASGDLAEAARLFQDGMNSTAVARQRFLLQVCMVELLGGQGKKADLVYAHCEKILQDIDRFHMEEWEPGLAFRSMRAVWRCYSRSRLTDMKRQAGELLMRMSRIDLPGTMSLVKS